MNFLTISYSSFGTVYCSAKCKKYAMDRYFNNYRWLALHDIKNE